jgi:uncharacterized protein
MSVRAGSDVSHANRHPGSRGGAFTMMRARCCAVVVVLGITASGARAQEVDLAPAEIVGAYRSGAGGLFLVGSASSAGITVRDLEDGVRGRFVPAGEDRYEQDGTSLRVHREQGRITAIEVAAPGATSRLLRRLPLRFAEVTWASDGSTIAGTLVLPAGDGPYPLIIAQPGSSWQTRYNEHGMFTALTFAASGIAGLAYDRRGFGGSDGEQLVPFARTAADLASGVDAMRLRFDLNPRQVGVFGLSQGGWIAPLAQTMTDGIAFLVLVGAAGSTPARQEIQRAVNTLRAEEFPESDVSTIRELQQTAFHYAATGEGWDDYVAARSRAVGKSWLRRVYAPAEPGAGNWMWGRLNGHYNPLPALLALQVPVLALWGEYDLNVDPEVNRAIFEVALDAARSRDHTLLIVPAADHELETASSPRDALATRPFVPGVFERMIEWVRQRTAARH